MNNYKNLKRILIILVVIAICMVGFFGIYIKDKNTTKNIVADYNLGMNLEGYRSVSLKVDDSSEEVIYDSEGNVAEDGENEDGTLKEGYTKKKEKTNPDEILTQENYKLSKEIIEKRLDKLGATQYNVKQNEADGTIIVELPEGSRTDEIVEYLQYKGSFNMTDNETQEELIPNEYVKDAMAMYSTTESGTTVYLNIEFNKEGKQKLEEITRTYIHNNDEEEAENEEEESEETEKKVDLNFEGSALISSGFEKPITNGTLQLSMGASKDSEEISQYLKQASAIATLISAGESKIQYTVDENMYVSATINQEQINIMIYTTIAIITVALVYWIIKYKVNGIMSAIVYIGTIGILALLLRYVNVVISLETIVAVYALLIANFSFMNYILKQVKKGINVNEAMKEAVKAKLNMIIVFSIIAVSFTFMSWLPIFSIGMVMFWGILSIAVCNYLFTRNILTTKTEE